MQDDRKAALEWQWTGYKDKEKTMPSKASALMCGGVLVITDVGGCVDMSFHHPEGRIWSFGGTPVTDLEKVKIMAEDKLWNRLLHEKEEIGRMLEALVG